MTDSQNTNQKAKFHLPGLFEFHELYKIFLPIFFNKQEWFYDWCEIASVYGSPADCLWAGGRIENGSASAEEVLSLMEEYGISARLTLSNSLLKEEHLTDKKCNALCALFEKSKTKSGVIVHSDLLCEHIKKNFPNLYLVSSTTKVLTDFSDFKNELDRPEFKYVVPDFRLNKDFRELDSLSKNQKEKTEFLCNECCDINCTARKTCYENVSRKNLCEEVADHKCISPDSKNGYRFSHAMKNQSFISIEDIQNIYLPMGFSNFKIEGRSLGSAIVLEFLLYYLTKPEHQLEVREEIYLDSMLDLF